MKPYALALLAIVALTSLGIFLVARSSVPAPTGPVAVAPPPNFAPPTVPTLPPSGPTTITPSNPPDLAQSPATNLAPLVASPRDQTSVPPVSDNDPLASERATIQALAASNNPANVPAIARYLEHADAGIRQEAVVGLITLGEKAGAPFLIAATVKAHTPEEADTLREAADFLTKDIKDTRLPPAEPDVTNDPSPQDLRP